MKDQVKALWKLCFDDSEQFVDMYFNKRYTDEINVAIENEGEVISALQMIPYPMTFCHQTIPTAYISGACTHPDHRGTGIMRQLLTQAFTKMLCNGTFISTLIPAEQWLFSYYEKMGYAPVFHYSYKEVMAPESLPNAMMKIDVIQLSEFNDEVYSYLSYHLSKRACCLQHTWKDFQTIIADLAVSNGCLVIASQGIRITGISFGYKRNDTVIINELIADSKEVEETLLYHTKQFTGYDRMIQLLPPTDGDGLPRQPLGMARIINAREILKLYAAAFPEIEMQFELTDDQLPGNNGYYLLQQGICVYTKEVLTRNYTQMNIMELTNRVFGSLHPYMSLMLN